MIDKLVGIGIAVSDLDAAIKDYTQLLGLQLKGKHRSERGDQLMAVLYVGNGGSRDGLDVHLVQPLTPDADVAKFIQRRGGGVYYLVVRTDDFDGDFHRWGDRQILLRQEPRIMPHGRAAYTHPKALHNVLLEVIEYDPEKRIKQAERWD